jgi:hypothetical protein
MYRTREWKTIAWHVSQMGMYPVHRGSPCAYHARELTNNLSIAKENSFSSFSLLEMYRTREWRTIAWHVSQMGMYPVHRGSPCTYHADELTKFTKKFKKFTHVLSIILHMCIKFQVKTYYSLSIIKKRNFWQIFDYRFRNFTFFTAHSLLGVWTWIFIHR